MLGVYGEGRVLLYKMQILLAMEKKEQVIVQQFVEFF